MIRQLHPLGWLPDRPDHRDLTSSVTAVPGAVDLRKFCSYIVDDGPVGFCSSSAVTGAMELLLRRRGESEMFSRAFLYHQTRVRLGINSFLDTGATIRDTLKALANDGVCRESTWPSVTGMMPLTPSTHAFTEAAKFKIAGYERLDSLAQIGAALASEQPVMGGFSLPRAALEDDVAMSGIIKFPNPGDKLAGGHAVLFVGMDAGFLLFKNSWGSAWGECGYGRLDARFVERGLARDFWTLRL